MDNRLSDDLAALGDHSQHQLRSLAATRAHVLSAQEKTKMRFFKNRPVLAALLALGFIGVAGGAAYAFDQIFLQVDATKSAPEIEQDVKTQLDNAGVTAEVHATKSAPDKVKLSITSHEPSPALENLQISAPPGTHAEQEAQRVRVMFDGDFGAEPPDVATVMQYDDVDAALETGDVTALKAALAAHGYTNVTVEVVDGAMSITIRPATK